jgi:lipopolysaccharide export LptBFGC system permease protein LptF
MARKPRCGGGVLGVESPREVNRRIQMLWTIAVILLVLWVLGLVSSYTLGGFIHVLLVVALVVFLVGVIQGRRV